jgi:hypothetical protein
MVVGHFVKSFRSKNKWLKPGTVACAVILATGTADMDAYNGRQPLEAHVG